jgi:hypothetical protein
MSKSGGGYFVPEEAWADLEDLIAIVAGVSAALDGPERPVTISSKSLASISNSLNKRLKHIQDAAVFHTGVNRISEANHGTGDGE